MSFASRQRLAGVATGQAGEWGWLHLHGNKVGGGVEVGVLVGVGVHALVRGYRALVSRVHLWEGEGEGEGGGRGEGEGGRGKEGEGRRERERGGGRGEEGERREGEGRRERGGEGEGRRERGEKGREVSLMCSDAVQYILRSNFPNLKYLRR